MPKRISTGYRHAPGIRRFALCLAGLLVVIDIGVWSWLAPALASDEAPGSDPSRASQASDIFLQKVQPVLKAKCLGCHGDGKKIESELDLRTRAGMLEGGARGPALVPGKPEQSLIYEAILRSGELVMPPNEKHRLTAEEAAALRAWIEAGAPWSGARLSKEQATQSDNSSDATWAFRPLRVPKIPTQGIEPARVKTPIDAFLLQKLQQKGLTPAPPSDRLTLIRRATFDLTGLPPTPDEIDAFVNDPAPNAFERVVARLLASPHYGEQWGRHWLDVVRYADTDGYSNDYERPHAWRYRDYVVRSFNQDKPYDRFIVEQLAGDELGPDDPELAVAAGFLRMGPWEHTAMSVAAVTRQLFLDDVTHNTVNTFLGLTMGCARCHDHKFDPLPTRDYYRLQAIFASAQFAERPAAFLPEENVTGFETDSERIRAQIRQTERDLQAIKNKASAALELLLEQHRVRDVKDLPETLRPKDKRFGLTEADQERERVDNKRLELLNRALKRYQPLAFTVSSGGDAQPFPAAEVTILIGGSLEAPGERVTPGVLSALAGAGGAQVAEAEDVIPTTNRGRRLALARWCASPANPLTARVMVNRIWQHHFGKGLVQTSNNFGKMGRRPTHPELLDWLAFTFVAEDWSLKAMHRLILCSAFYQESAEHDDMERVRQLDPDNSLLAYYPPRRLTAEEVRDSILAVSGELSVTRGGPPVYPEMNRDVAFQPRQIMGTIAPVYCPSPRREQRHRRTLYTVQQRNLVNPLQEVFNASDMNLSCERREATTVVPQVGALFNGEFAHDMALAMARRLEQLAHDRPGQVEHAFQLAYGRRPTERERDLCVDHLRAMTEHHRRVAPMKQELSKQIVRTHIGELTGTRIEFLEKIDLDDYEPNLKPIDVGPETRALSDLCLVLLNSNEFIYLH